MHAKAAKSITFVVFADKHDTTWKQLPNSVRGGDTFYFWTDALMGPTYRFRVVSHAEQQPNSSDPDEEKNNTEPKNEDDDVTVNNGENRLEEEEEDTVNAAMTVDIASKPSYVTVKETPCELRNNIVYVVHTSTVYYVFCINAA